MNHIAIFVSFFLIGGIAATSILGDEPFFPCEEHVRTVATTQDFTARVLTEPYGKLGMKDKLEYSSEITVLKTEQAGEVKKGVKIFPYREELFDVTPLKFTVTVKSALKQFSNMAAAVEQTAKYIVKAEYRQSYAFVLEGHPSSCSILTP